jgi:hypothetical protein
VVPDIHSINDRLMKGCIMAGRLAEAAEAAEKFTLVMGHPKLFLRAASIRAQLKQWDRVEETLSRGLGLFPDSPELQEARTEATKKRLASVGTSAPEQPITE